MSLSRTLTHEGIEKRLVNVLIFDPASLKDAQVCARHKI
jgi:hypothetical protein